MGTEKKTFTIEQRSQIVAEVADAIRKKQRNAFSSVCRKYAISRMALWYWVKADPFLAKLIDNAKNKIRFAKNEKKKADEARYSGKPKRWRRRKPVVAVCPGATKASPRKNGDLPLVQCKRCGHRWVPRGETVSACPHVTCKTRFFLVAGRFSDEEKKAAKAARKDHDLKIEREREKKRWPETPVSENTDHNNIEGATTNEQG